MSNYDRSANARYGGVAQAGVVDQGLRAYMIGVYNYMTLGLGVTGLVAFGAFKLAAEVDSAGHIVKLTGFGDLIYRSPLHWVILFAPLAVVLLISARTNTMSVASARNVFLFFAVTVGVSVSWIFLRYSDVSIGNAFFQTAATFGALSLYGYTTRRDLTPFGSFLMMGLFGLIIAMVVNMFLQSSGLQWALSVLTVVVFAGLTAWDTQSIKERYFAGDSYETGQKKSIFGALHLYLDFLNIFISLLQLTGSSRNN